MTNISFAILDDLCLAAQMNSGRLQSLRQPLVAASLGVAIEMLLFRTVRQGLSIVDFVEVDFSEVRPIVRLWQRGYQSSLNSDLAGMGFVRVSKDTDQDEIEWTRFGLFAQQCAYKAGVPKPTAAQLVAAAGELRSNILEHSESMQGGVVAFLADSAGIEFVVADQGIGLLASLRQNIEYNGVMDHGTALKVALTEGTSRYGTGIGHGYGFRPIFVGLANAVGEIRFRTGDHALTMAGDSPSLIHAKVAQKAHFGGFLAYFRWSSNRAALRQS